MSKKNGRPAPQPEPSVAPPVTPPVMDAESNIDEIPLDETTALAIQLGQSRMNEAQLATQLRQKEMQATLDRVRTRYEEGGKYTVQSVNLEKMVVLRIPVEQDKPRAAPPDAAPPTSN